VIVVAWYLTVLLLVLVIAALPTGRKNGGYIERFVRYVRRFGKVSLGGLPLVYKMCGAIEDCTSACCFFFLDIIGSGNS